MELDKIIIDIKTNIDESGFQRDAKNLKTQIGKLNDSEDTTVDIDTKIDLDPLQQLKKELKEARAEVLKFEEGSEGFVKASKRAGELKDRLDATNQSIKQFSASPFENISSSIRGMRDSIFNLDIDGFKNSFGGLTTSLGGVVKQFGVLKTAIIGTGIGAIVIAVGLLIANFDKLTTSGGILGSIFQGIGVIVNKIKDFFIDLSDTLGLTEIRAGEAAEKIKKSYEEAFNFIEGYNNRRLQIAKALNEDTYELEKEILQDQLDFNRQKLLDLRDSKGRESEEYIKQRDLVRKIQTDLEVLDITRTNKIKEENLKRVKDNKTTQDQLLKDSIDKSVKERNDEVTKQRFLLQQKLKELEDLRKIRIKEGQDRRDDLKQQLEDFKAYRSQIDAILIEREVKRTQDLELQRKAQSERDIADETAAREKSSRIQGIILQAFDIATTITGTISDILNQISDNRIQKLEEETNIQIQELNKQKEAGIISEEVFQRKKNEINEKAAKKELELRKKAFKQNKAIQIVNAVIGTAQGVVAALANPFPLNIIMSALAAATGAAQIGLIASQKFPESGGDTSGSAPSAPSSPSIPSSGESVNRTVGTGFTAPQFFGLNGLQAQTGNNQPTQKIYISENEITQTQRKVNVYERRSVIG